MLRQIWALPMRAGDEAARDEGLGKCPWNQGLQSVPRLDPTELIRPGELESACDEETCDEEILDMPGGQVYRGVVSGSQNGNLGSGSQRRKSQMKEPHDDRDQYGT